MRPWLLLGLAIAGATAVPPAEASGPSVQVLAPAGATYNRAQVLDWIDEAHFAVGRWDGTVSIFRVPVPGEYGPVVEQAWAAASGRGVEMLTVIDARVVAVSDGPGRIAVWKRGAGRRYALAANLAYAEEFGVANSGATLTSGRSEWFVSGHESGHVLIWKRLGATRFTLVRAVDLRSAHPIPALHPLRNIRDLVRWREHYLIAGSEDGDLVAIDIPGGAEVFRQRYNATAQRGINDLAVAGDWLLVANCAVGANDRNLWLFDLARGTPQLSDSANLVSDTQRAQVFNFEAELVRHGDRLEFFSSTEEGLLWRGVVDAGRLVPSGYTRVAPEGGAVLDESPDATALAAAAGQILLFKTD